MDPETSADLAPEVIAVPQEPFLVSLLDILEKVIAGEELAHSEEFRNYLQQVRVKDDLDSVLSVDSDGVWVRPVKNLQQERLIAILSALYSAFNRGQAEVSDSDERVFHARILEYASSGIYGGVKGASP